MFKNYFKIAWRQSFVYNNPSGIIALMVISLQTSNLPHIFVCASKMMAIGKTLLHKLGKQKLIIKEDLKNGVLLVWLPQNLALWRYSLHALVCFGLSSFLAEKRGKEISIRKVFGANGKCIWLY